MARMRRALLIVLLAGAGAAQAQVYRWVDEKGRVTYSNSAPPPGVTATLVDPQGKAGVPSVESSECYSLRCQGERMEERLARREELETRLAAERAAALPLPPRGLEFRKYISLQRGMSEGELLVIAGAPDFLSNDVFADKTYTYFPTALDPFTTTVWVIGGRINRIERVRKF